MSAPPGRREWAGWTGLVVVATPIGNLEDLSDRARRVLAEADLVCCEDTRRTGKLLGRAGVRASRLVSLHARNERARIPSVVRELTAGRTVALVSDAGTPLLSDPGGRLVAAAVGKGMAVSVVPGPSASVAALVLSGFDASRFRFEGFLPRAGTARWIRLGEIAASPCPSIVFESPKRLSETIRDLVEVAGPVRRLAVCRELTKLHEEVWRGPLAEAAEQFADAEPIGEHVLVVDAAPRPPAPGRAEARGALDRLEEAGVTGREATTAVEVLLGIAHRAVFEAAVERRHPSKAAPSRPIR